MRSGKDLIRSVVKPLRVGMSFSCDFFMAIRG